ncbi:MAG: DNA repair protein RecO [Crocinitomicaceae bacterium]|nr:DNA repair protein RecO [Crocinitomicaceae bacterium]
MKQTDLGLFLHRTSYSESSLITTFYTQHNGLQKFVYQGAKKKNANLFPMGLYELTFYHRPDSELGKLTQADTVLPTHSILTNPIKSLIAFFITDIVKQTLKTNEQEQVVFDFLKTTSITLDSSEDLVVFPLVFLVEYSFYIGIQPQFNEGEKPLYFNLKEGEFHEDYRIGELCESGENARQLANLFQNKSCDVRFRKQGLELLLNYYQLHIPKFDVKTSLDIIREVLM